MFNNIFRLLFINVHMPDQGDGDTTADFGDPLSEIESLINSYSDCQVSVGVDFNVDF